MKTTKKYKPIAGRSLVKSSSNLKVKRRVTSDNWGSRKMTKRTTQQSRVRDEVKMRRKKIISTLAQTLDETLEERASWSQ